MPFTLLPLLLFAPPTGAQTSSESIAPPRWAAIGRTVRQHQDDFVIVDGDATPAGAPPPTTVMLGTHIGLDRALIEAHGLRSGSAAR